MTKKNNTARFPRPEALGSSHSEHTPHLVSLSFSKTTASREGFEWRELPNRLSVSYHFCFGLHRRLWNFFFISIVNIFLLLRTRSSLCPVQVLASSGQPNHGSLKHSRKVRESFDGHNQYLQQQSRLDRNCRDLKGSNRPAAIHRLRCRRLCLLHHL